MEVFGGNMFVNGNGIPCIETQAVDVSSTAVTFSFKPTLFARNYSGLIIVRVTNDFTAPATAVPVQFTTQGVTGSTQAVLNGNYTPITSADWGGIGTYLFFYDRENNQLVLL